MRTSRPQSAFLAAALVLLVPPVLEMLGLGALGQAMDLGTMSQVKGMMRSTPSIAFLCCSSHLTDGPESTRLVTGSVAQAVVADAHLSLESSDDERRRRYLRLRW